jgi:hypothetical protein
MAGPDGESGVVVRETPETRVTTAAVRGKAGHTNLGTKRTKVRRSERKLESGDVFPTNESR